MKPINKLSLVFLVLLIIIIPILVFILNSGTNKQIEENAITAQNYAKVSAEREAETEDEYARISKEIPGIVCI